MNGFTVGQLLDALRSCNRDDKVLISTMENEALALRSLRGKPVEAEVNEGAC